MNRHELDAVLRARSVAVIGASRSPEKRGYQAVRSLLAAGFRGAVYPVNPAGGEICGLHVYASLEDIDDVPDLALLCTPAASAPDLIEACGRKGVRGAVVLAVGFAEAGADGVELQAALAAAARRSGVRVVGPNTSGILNPHIGLNVIGVRDVPAGSLGLLVQSGNVALAVMTEARQQRDVGFSAVIGVGNEADIGFHEYLDWFAADAATAAVLMYAESFRDVQSVLAAARRVTTHKPVVLLLGGATDEGRRAARSHTGAVISRPALLRDSLSQAGVIRVARSDELLPVGLTLASQPAARAGGIAVLSDGGGHGTLCADALAALSAPLATFSPDTSARLRALLGPAAGVNNPVDLAGAADRAPLVFAEVAETLLQDPAVGSLLLTGLFGGYALRFAPSLASDEAMAAQRMATAAQRAGVPLVVHTLYARHDSDALLTLHTRHVPVFGSIEVAARCSAATHEYSAVRSRAQLLQDASATATGTAPATGTPFPGLLELARAQRRDALLEPEARTLVRSWDIPVVEGVFCTDADAAVAHVSAADGPFVGKLVSSTISHKAAAGGVVLGIRNTRDMAAAWQRVRENTTRYALEHGVDADMRGMLLTRMLAMPLAELLVGARRDPEYGPIIVLGAGGSDVEQRADVSTRLLPLAEEDVVTMLAATAAGRTLLARPDFDSTALTRLVLDFARGFLQHEPLEELELNPVFVYRDHVVAVDARAFVALTGSGMIEGLPA
jgi:acetate---CoA ligase (ADP-forming)